MPKITELPEYIGPLTGAELLPLETPAGSRKAAASLFIGPLGQPAKTILGGLTPPDSSTGTDDDFYIDYVEWTIYGPKTAGAWGAPHALTGPQGPAGEDGAAASADPVALWLFH